MDQGAYAAVVVQLMLIGAALGVIIPAITSALLGSVDRSRSGVASGTLNTARQSGSVVGVALFGSLFATDRIAGLHVALLIGVALAVLTVVLAAALQVTADE